MRISDWSSDVCSSDLVDHVGQGGLHRLHLHARRQFDIGVEFIYAAHLADQTAAGHDLVALLPGIDLGLMLLHLLLLRTDQQEIEDNEDEDQDRKSTRLNSSH